MGVMKLAGNSAATTTVKDVFQRAQSYITTNSTSAQSFINNLNRIQFTAPTVGVQWQNISMPNISAPTKATFTLVTPRSVGDAPQPIPTSNLSFDNMSIPTLSAVAPTTTQIAVPTLNIGAVPTAPTTNLNVALPDAPTISIDALPALLSTTIPTTPSVEFHQEMVNEFRTIPLLELLDPVAFNYTPPAAYSDDVIAALKTALQTRLAGGTGLPPAVEQALWDRARERESAAAANEEADVVRLAENSGFPMPTGALTYNLIAARQRYQDKMSSLSRDISIKQAELEQENIKHAIDEGLKLEGLLIDQANKMIQLGFETAKFEAENAVQIYNSQATAYGHLLEAYKTYAAAYKTVIEGETLKVEVYKGQLQAEMSKAEINKSAVEAYKARIQGQTALVEIYKSEVDAAKSLVEMERAKIESYRYMVEGYVASVNAETAKLTAVKTEAEIQGVQAQTYETQVKAYTAQVGAVAEAAKVKVAQLDAIVRAKEVEFKNYSSKIDAERLRVDTLFKNSELTLEGAKTDTASMQAYSQLQISAWEGQMKQYEAGKNIALSTAKINSDILLANRTAVVEAAKVGAQVYAQLVASAYGSTNVSASISAGVSDSTSESVQDSYGHSWSNSTSTSNSYTQTDGYSESKTTNYNYTGN